MKYRDLILFAAGLVVGGVGTWLIVKKYYEDLANEEIESVKDYYKQDLAEKKGKAEQLGKEKAAMADQILYRETVKHTAYSAISQEGDEEESMETERVIAPIPDPLPEPYIITPDQYVAEERDFEKVTVTWYVRNKVLVSEDDELVEIETSIGEEALEHFSEYMPNLVYVRNEKLEIDYEVILDEDEYYPMGE